MRRLVLSLAFASAFLVAPPRAMAISYTFSCITDNSGGLCQSALETQLQGMTVAGGSQVGFTFENLGPLPSIITAAYWEDSQSLLASMLAGPFTSPGVIFVKDGSVGTLPGGSVVNFTESFSASREQAGGVSTGVNEGESVTILFNLAPGFTTDDVDAALAAGTLRIGIHVQSIQGGSSDSLIAVPGSGDPVTIPEPSTFALLGASLVAIGVVRRRQR